MDFNRDLYLDLMKRSLSAYIYEESSNRPITVDYGRRYTPKELIKAACLTIASRLGWRIEKKIPFDPKAREEGRDWPGIGYTMIGLRRLDNLQACIEDILNNNVPGDMIETGVWRGGASIFMRAVLKSHSVSSRRVWLADSFEGMPVPDTSDTDTDQGYDLSSVDYLSVSLDQVRENFRKFNLLDDQVGFLKGWFKDTLPSAPIEQLALLRLDGDLYESTMDALVHLYDRVSGGGYVVVDDYHNWPPCRQAVDEFRQARSIHAELREIDGRGVYWQVEAVV